MALTQKFALQAARHLADWLGFLRTEHGDRILAITDQIAVEWGRRAALRPRGDADGRIAATARIHGLILVTRIVHDFEDTGILIRNPCDL